MLLLLVFLLLPWAAWTETPFNHIWSGFSTSLANRSPEQRRNTVIAGKMMDRTVVPPGGVFSFNEQVGARDRAKGFVSAPNFNFSGLLEDAPGGGICQLASTIYNAGLLAGLEVVERHPHSRTVAHVPPGRDATISSWRKDLKLRNPFPQPLILRISFDDNRLIASFRSVVPKRFQVELKSRRIPLEPETVAASSGAAEQPGGPGFTTSTWRITRRNGVETSELISEDTYPPPTRIITGASK